MSGGEKRSGAEAPVPISSSWAAVFWRQLEGTIQSRNREREETEGQRSRRGEEIGTFTIIIFYLIYWPLRQTITPYRVTIIIEKKVVIV